MNLVLIVLYMTGSPTDEDNFRLDHEQAQYSMQALTILNVSASRVKTSIAFLYAVTIVAGLAFCFVLRYLSLFKKRTDSLEEDIAGLVGQPHQVQMIELEELKQNNELLEDQQLSVREVKEWDAAEHTVLVTGIPMNMPQAKVEQQVKKIFTQILENDGF